MSLFIFLKQRWPSICLLLATIPSSADAMQCPAEVGLGSINGSTRTWAIAVPGFENLPPWASRTVFVYVPSSYQTGNATPLVIALHGTAGSPTAAVVQAASVLERWKAAAEAGGFIVAAPVAGGSQGSWIAPINELDTPSDYDLLRVVTDRAEREFSVDTSRRYLWGFSSGGHVALDIALNRYHRSINADFFAGFSAHAGVSAGLACSGLTAAECNQRVFAAATGRRPIDIHIGTSDPLWSRAQEDRTRFLANQWLEGVTFFWQPFAGGHEVPSAQLIEVWNNLCPFRSQGAKSPITIGVANPIRVDAAAETSLPSRPATRQRNKVSGLRHQDTQR